MIQKQLIICGVVVIIVGIASFFGGMQYQKRQRVTFANGQFGPRTGRNGQQFQGGPGGGMAGQGFRPAAGVISGMDDKSITIKLMDNSSKIIILSDKTVFNKTTLGSKSDIKTGDTISVFGTSNSDGSITANSISIGAMLTPAK